MMLSETQFERICLLASELAGIALCERHREVLARRTFRYGIRSSAEMDIFLSSAERGDAQAIGTLLSLLTTKFTRFFRHPEHFERAAQHVLEAVRQRGFARLWSAAAATGEEPYSLAIALSEAFECDGSTVKIIATDLDAEALRAAERGQYTEIALRTVHPERRSRFFAKLEGSERWQIKAEIRRMVEFRMMNLVTPDEFVHGPFDIVFCRNVLMYLQVHHRIVLLEKVARALAHDGLLMLDPTEYLGKAEALFSPRADGIYSLRKPCRREPLSTTLLSIDSGINRTSWDKTSVRNIAPLISV